MSLPEVAKRALSAVLTLAFPSGFDYKCFHNQLLLLEAFHFW